MIEVDNGKNGRRAGLEEERFADVFTQLRFVQAGVSSGDTPSIGGGLPSFIEQVAYQGGGGIAPSGPEPWELRIGTDEEGRACLDVYQPGGTYEVFLSANAKVTRESAASPGSQYPDVGGGWKRLGVCEELAGSSGFANVNALLSEITYDIYVGSQNESVTATRQPVGRVDKAADGSFVITQRLTGKFAIVYEWTGTEAVLADGGSGMLTTDLGSVSWGPNTMCYLCRLYAKLMKWDGTVSEIENPSIPIAEDGGGQVFVNKIVAVSHANEHFDSFFPFNTEDEA